MADGIASIGRDDGASSKRITVTGEREAVSAGDDIIVNYKPKDYVDLSDLGIDLKIKISDLLNDSTSPVTSTDIIKTHKTATEWIIATKVDDVSRLKPLTILATPEIEAAAYGAISEFSVTTGTVEKLGFGYLMSDGTFDVRAAANAKAGSTGSADTQKGGFSGAGTVKFGIHGHIDSVSDGMVDDVGAVSKRYGDTQSIAAFGIPMATVFKGQIGWHEIRGGQLIFRAPISALTSAQRMSIQSNINTSQKNFLLPKVKK